MPLASVKSVLPTPNRTRPALPLRAAAVLVALVTLLSGLQIGGGDSAEAAGVRRLQTGAQVFSVWRDWTVNDRMLDQLAAAGAGWVRIDVGWCSLEEAGPQQISGWYQDRLDKAVDAARSRGLKVLVTLACTPGWSSGKPDNFQVLPKDTGEYQRVSSYLAARYAGRVAAWEIWNEPDCSTGTCGATPAADYLPVLKAGFAGVRRGDPRAIVVTGGTSGNNDRWIRDLYKAGAKGYFDALAVHSYQGPVATPPEAPQNGSPYRLTNIERVRQVMRDYADTRRKIWITEMGWSTGAGEGWYAGVDEPLQAEYTERALRQIQTMYPYVTTAFVYAMRDRDDWSAYENNFGLLHNDGSAKPSLTAFKRANVWLATMR